MPKQSQLPQDANPSPSDRVTGLQVGVPQAVTFLLSSLINLFWTLANIPSGATSPITRDNESQFSFVASGLVWSGDAYASTKNASMTAGVIYINGRRISISAVTARTFTASKDTYIDILDNGDGTGTLVYTEVTNNAASPALASNSTRIGIIVTGASNIANSGSVNQGQEQMILPIASSIAYSVVDSIGNLICPRDPAHRILGYRQLIADQNTGSTTVTALTGLTVPLNNIPTGRKIIGKLYAGEAYASGTNRIEASVWDGIVGSGTQVAGGWAPGVNGTFSAGGLLAEFELTPGAATKTYNGGFLANSAGTATFSGTSTHPSFLRIELA